MHETVFKCFLSSASPILDHDWTMFFLTYDLPQFFKMRNLSCYFFGLIFGKCLACSHVQWPKERGDGEMCSSFTFKSFAMCSSFKMCIFFLLLHVVKSDAAVLLCSSQPTVYQKICRFCMSSKFVEVEQASSRDPCYRNLKYIPNGHSDLEHWYFYFLTLPPCTPHPQPNLNLF